MYWLEGFFFYYRGYINMLSVCEFYLKNLVIYFFFDDMILDINKYNLFLMIFYFWEIKC